MNYFFGALLGLVWGAGAAVLNAAVTRRFFKKQSVSLTLAANMIRLFVDIAALGACLLLRGSESVSFYTAIMGTAVSLSMLTIVFAYRMARPDTDASSDTDAKPDTDTRA